MSRSLVRHCAPPSYSCVIPRYGAGLAGMCATCSGMLARGDFAQDVAEERYDTEGTTMTASGYRYNGLMKHEARMLAAAITELCFLRTKWQLRAEADEDWHEAETSPDVLGAEDEADAAADRAYDEARDWEYVHS